MSKHPEDFGTLALKVYAAIGIALLALVFMFIADYFELSRREARLLFAGGFAGAALIYFGAKKFFRV